MRKRFWKRMTALICTVSMFIGISCSGLEGSIAYASAVLGYWPETLEYPNQYYYEGQTLQPYGTCFQIDELKNWSPDNDPDARYNRGAIALRDRWMGPNVNPKASRDAKVMPLAMGNARASQALSQGGDGVSTYNFNNFQYVTNYNFWGGSSGEGPIAIPSPELIDSAHRNGVPVTGTIFIPWGDSAYGNQFVSEMVEKAPDGSFPAADKLIEIAQYYGFDGYIFNAESGTGVAGFKEFLAYIQQKKPDNFTITWYNGSGSLSEGSIKSWMQDGSTRLTDEWWLDMSGSGNVDSTIAAAKNLGVNPWNIYSTWENWPMGPSAKGGYYQNRLDENGVLKCSLGILAPTASLMESKSPEEFLNVMDQKLWVGPDFDPSSDYYPSNEFCGFAHMVADRTPVIGTDFVTNFNAGNGYRFYENGVVTGKTGGWYNRSLGDVLPTWRWIIDTQGQKLDASIDYANAWEGGTSLKLSGGMDAGLANHVKLYSSQLYITNRTQFSMTYKTNDPGVQVELGLCFGDTYDDQNFKFYPVETSVNGQWATSTVDLSADAGETAIAISLRLTAPGGVAGYAINVGEMAFTTSQSAPAAVSAVTLDEVLYHSDSEMEARIYWQKAPGAFIYRIHRVHADGTKEFVGATPSDAFYLNPFVRDGEEEVCTFEITPYSENGVAGGSTQFVIDWPEKVENGFAPVFEEGENLALKRPILSSGSPAGNGVHQLVDGTVLNGSKWCVDSSRSGYAILDLGENKTIQRWVVYHANCPGAGESPTMNTVDFDLQYAEDDGGELLDSTDSASVSRVSSLSYTVADTVRDNKMDVTDRNLAEPITARYIKLNVTNGDRSPWVAVRIYELELYEKTMPEGYSSAASPNAKNITMRSGGEEGDTLIVDNVTMLYSSGSYQSKDGVFHEDTGKVRLFTSLEAEEPVAVAKAIQPNESYKQRSVGIAKFEGLNFEEQFPGGRIYYDVLDGSGAEVLHTRRASVAYPPSTGEAPAKPGSVELIPTTGGVQLRKQYAKMVATGVEAGAVIHIFDSAGAEIAILRTLPAQADGVIQQERVPLDKEGGSIWYEVHKEGKPDSQRYELPYSATADMSADLTGLREWIAKCEAVSGAGCTSGSYAVLSDALAAAKNVAEGNPTMAQAEEARAALAAAYAGLSYKGNSQRLSELCAECEAKYLEEENAASTWEPYQAALDAAKAAIAANDSSNAEYEQLRIALESAASSLKEKFTVTGVTVSPETAKVVKGSEKQFTATVETNAEPITEATAVTWTVSGGTSAETLITETGLLKVGGDETAQALTVTATSVDDPAQSGEAAVEVAEGAVVKPSVNLALNAEILGYSGNPGAAETPQYAMDGDITTKWCTEGTPAWMAFDIGIEVYPELLKVMHAGAAGDPGDGVHDYDFNTRDFTFEILDPEKCPEDVFFALDEAGKAAVLAADDNWMKLVDVAGNTEHITEHSLASDHPARIFRMKVTHADENWWNGADTVRIYEIELYGTEPVDPTENLALGAEILGSKGNATGDGAVEGAFDGNLETKWCAEGTPAWVAFDTGVAAYPVTLKVLHAGAGGEGADLNTRDFTFEILNPDRYSEEEFLALDDEQRAAILDADENWIALVSVSKNVEDVTEHELTTDGTARIFRLKVTDGDENPWHGTDTVRIYEIELYGSSKKPEKPVEITVTIDPAELTVTATPGQKGQFTALVDGTDNQEVIWSISGNTSEGTLIANGQLFIGTDETAAEMIVTATSVENPDSWATARVILTAEGCAHVLTRIEAKEPTCTEPGNMEYWTCSECGKLFKDGAATEEITLEDTVIPAAGHQYEVAWIWTEDYSNAAATFTCPNCQDLQYAVAEVTYENGWYTATAVFEGEVYTDWKEAEQPPVHQHALERTEARPATCTEEGSTGYWYCTACGRYYSDAEATDEITQEDTVIAATGHAYALTRWEWAEDLASATAVFTCANDAQHVEYAQAQVTEEPDENGNRVFTATAVFEDRLYTESRTVEVPPVEDHELIHVEGYAPTCEADGLAEHWYCQTCGKYYSDAGHTVQINQSAAILPATGHSDGEPVWIWAEDGYTAEAVFACGNCGREERQEAVVTIHRVDGKVYFVASVTTAGGKTYTDSRGVEQPPVRHELTYTAAQAPACTEGGHTAYWYCAQCGKYFSDGEHQNEITLASTALPAAGHRYGAPQWTWNGNAAAFALFTCQTNAAHTEVVMAVVTSETVPATIYADGRITYTASAAFGGTVYTDSWVETIPALTPEVPYPPYVPTIPSTPSTPSTSGGSRPSTTPTQPDISIPEDPTPLDPGTDIGETDVPLASILLPFRDVAFGEWHRDAVAYVYSKGMMSGTTDTTFEPDSTINRGMIVTMLHRLEGTPAAGYSAFEDVLADQYYAAAVAWAAQNGVVTGTSATTFAPEQNITREQLAAILFRYAQLKGYDTSKRADLAGYTDQTDISGYALEAMRWAVAEGLITGKTGNTLVPGGEATRAEAAVILMRFCENVAK